MRVGNRQMKKCLPPLIIKVTQIKATVGDYCTQTIPIIKKSTNNKCWQGWGEKGILFYSIRGTANWCSDYRNCMNVSQKTTTRTFIRPNNSTPGYIPEGKKNTTLKRYLHPNAHSSIVYNSQDMGATSVSINE